MEEQGEAAHGDAGTFRYLSDCGQGLRLGRGGGDLTGDVEQGVHQAPVVGAGHDQEVPAVLLQPGDGQALFPFGQRQAAAFLQVRDQAGTVQGADENDARSFRRVNRGALAKVDPPGLQSLSRRLEPEESRGAEGSIHDEGRTGGRAGRFAGCSPATVAKEAESGQENDQHHEQRAPAREDPPNSE